MYTFFLLFCFSEISTKVALDAQVLTAIDLSKFSKLPKKFNKLSIVAKCSQSALENILKQFSFFNLLQFLGIRFNLSKIFKISFEFHNGLLTVSFQIWFSSTFAVCIIMNFKGEFSIATQIASQMCSIAIIIEPDNLVLAQTVQEIFNKTLTPVPVSNIAAQSEDTKVLQQIIKDLQQKIDKLNAKLNAQKGELTDSKAQEYENRLERLKNELKRIKDEHETKITQKESEIKKLKEEKNKLEQEKNNLAEQNSKLTENHALKQKIEELNKKIAQLEASKQQLEASKELTNAQMEQQLKDQIDKLIRINNLHEFAQKQNEDRINQLTLEINNLSTRLTAAQHAVTSAQQNQSEETKDLHKKLALSEIEKKELEKRNSIQEIQLTELNIIQQQINGELKEKHEKKYKKAMIQLFSKEQSIQHAIKQKAILTYFSKWTKFFLERKEKKSKQLELIQTELETRYELQEKESKIMFEILSKLFEEKNQINTLILKQKLEEEAKAEQLKQKLEEETKKLQEETAKSNAQLIELNTQKQALEQKQIVPPNLSTSETQTEEKPKTFASTATGMPEKLSTQVASATEITMEKIDSDAKELASLTTQLEKINTEKKDLLTSLKQKKETISQLNAQINTQTAAAKEEIKSLQAQIANATAANAQTTAAKEAEIKDLTTKLEKANADLANATAANAQTAAEKEAEIKDLTTKLEKANADLANATAANAQTAAEKEAEIKDLTTKLNAAKTQLDATKTELDNAKKDFADANQNSNTQTAAAQEEINALKAQIEKANEELTKATAAKEEAIKDLTTKLNAAKADLEKAKKDFSNANQSANTQTAAAQEEINALKAQIEKANADLAKATAANAQTTAAKEAEIKDLTTKLEKANADKEEIQQELDVIKLTKESVDEAANDLEKQVTTLQEKLHAAKEEADKATAALAAKENEFKALKVSEGNTNEAVQKAVQNENKAKEEARKAQAELAAAQEKLEKALTDATAKEEKLKADIATKQQELEKARADAQKNANAQTEATKEKIAALEAKIGATQTELTKKQQELADAKEKHRIEIQTEREIITKIKTEQAKCDCAAKAERIKELETQRQNAVDSSKQAAAAKLSAELEVEELKKIVAQLKAKLSAEEIAGEIAIKKAIDEKKDLTTKLSNATNEIARLEQKIAQLQANQTPETGFQTGTLPKKGLQQASPLDILSKERVIPPTQFNPANYACFTQDQIPSINSLITKDSKKALTDKYEEKQIPTAAVFAKALFNLFSKINELAGLKQDPESEKEMFALFLRTTLLNAKPEDGELTLKKVWIEIIKINQTAITTLISISQDNRTNTDYSIIHGALTTYFVAQNIKTPDGSQKLGGLFFNDTYSSDFPLNIQGAHFLRSDCPMNELYQTCKKLLPMPQQQFSAAPKQTQPIPVAKTVYDQSQQINKTLDKRNAAQLGRAY